MDQMIQLHYEMLVSLFNRKSTLRLLLSFGVSALILRLCHRLYEHHSLNVKLKVKRTQLDQNMTYLRERISTNSLDCQLGPERLQMLTQLSVGELRKLLNDGSVQPADILHAFQRKALSLYDQKNSGICEFILEVDGLAESLQRQPTMDETRSPLFGIPISVKEMIGVAGYDATLGLAKRCQQPQQCDSVILDVLKMSGALPFVITTTSQCARSLCGYNPVFGSATNPFVSTRVPGGSSTGEAVLLSQHGSPLGIGTDLLGSIRIPAAYCGLVSLKPTTNRLSSLGLASADRYSKVHLKVCPGPMGRRVDDLVDVMRTLLTRRMFDLDPCLPPLPFNEGDYQGTGQSKLVIGYYDNLSDPYLMSTIRVVRETVALSVKMLASAGHKIVKFTPPNPLLAHHLALRAISVDGGKELRSLLRSEPGLCPQVSKISLVTGLPYPLKVISDLLFCAFGYRPLAIAHTLCGLSTSRAVLKLLQAIQDYRQQFLTACRSAGPLDAIVCPVSPFPAPLSNQSLLAGPSTVYTSVYNLVDLPAGTVPVGVVDEADIIDASTSAINLYLSGRNFDAWVTSSLEGGQGLPLAVQVVGMPYREEVVLRVMRTIEKAVLASDTPT